MWLKLWQLKKLARLLVDLFMGWVIRLRLKIRLKFGRVWVKKLGPYKIWVELGNKYKSGYPPVKILSIYIVKCLCG